MATNTVATYRQDEDPEMHLVNMETITRIAHGLLIAAVVILAALLIGVQTELLPGYTLKIVSSGSMEPTITTGSLILTSAAERYQVGDVITWSERRGSLPTTHRIIGERLQNGRLVYETQGDANDDPDPRPVRNDEVIGKVVLSVPYLGYVLDFARQPLGFALIIVVPALFVAFEEVSAIWREIKGRRKKEAAAGENKTDGDQPVT